MTLRSTVKYWLHRFVPGWRARLMYFGTAVYFPPDALLLRIVCDEGIFEADIVRRMTALVRPETTVFDVGANLGLMAVPVLQACATCRVVSLEPSPNSLPCLQRTRDEGQYRDRWTIVAAAAGAQTGTADFAVGSSSDALYEGFRSGDRLAGGRTIQVPVTTLDAEWRRLGTPTVSLIKIDVEGAEAAVFEGAGDLLRRDTPAILVEWHPAYLRRFQTPPMTLLRLAESYGYELFTVPAGVRVDSGAALTTQLIDCQNFLLLSAERSRGA